METYWDSYSKRFFVVVVTCFCCGFVFFVQLTAVLAWRPHLHSQKWLSCSVQSLEMFSCVLSCEEDTALSIIDPTSALVELNNARRQKGRKNAGLLDIAEEQLPSLEVSLGKFFNSLQVGDYSNRGTWKKIIQSQRFLETKDSQVYFQTDQCHSRLYYATVENFETVWTYLKSPPNSWMLLVHCKKKKAWESFVLENRFDWIIFF